jgi:hypothetical protein
MNAIDIKYPHRAGKRSATESMFPFSTSLLVQNKEPGGASDRYGTATFLLFRRRGCPIIPAVADLLNTSPAALGGRKREFG